MIGSPRRRDPVDLRKRGQKRAAWRHDLTQVNAATASSRTLMLDMQEQP
jgi:hypothetical protein